MTRSGLGRPDAVETNTLKITLDLSTEQIEDLVDAVGTHKMWMSNEGCPVESLDGVNDVLCAILRDHVVLYTVVKLNAGAGPLKWFEDAGAARDYAIEMATKYPGSTYGILKEVKRISADVIASIYEREAAV